MRDREGESDLVDIEEEKKRENIKTNETNP